MNSNNVYHFFMSATTPKGFASHLCDLTNYNKFDNTLIIKGPAGSGKSTLIKRAVEKLGMRSCCELIHCSQDSQSLDGAIINDRAVSLVDATSPHVVEPTLAGSKQRVVSLYDFFDSEILKDYEKEIINAYESEKAYGVRIQSFIRAAGMLLSSNEKLSARCVNRDKLLSFATRLCSREIKGKKSGIGEIKIRYLSSVCENGILMFTDTVEKMCSKIYKIEDTPSAVAPVLLESVTRAATRAGYDVYVCLCPLSDSDKIDHVLIPELSLAFMTSNKFHPIKIENARTIHTSRFYDREKLSEYSIRTSFTRRAAREILKEAGIFMKKKMQCHTRLENYYVQACDFEERDRYFDSFIEKID